MELDHHGSLSQSMWSKLPQELLVNIIYQTTDEETLSRWCKATQGSQLFHQTAMKAKWKTVVIDERDLLPAPGDDEDYSNRMEMWLKKRTLGWHWKPVGKMVRALLTKSNTSGQYPANYVRNIVFDFRMLRYWKSDIRDGEISAYDLMPSLKALKYTLSMLRGRLSSLRYISCRGDTPQAILDFIASKATTIYGLDIRIFGAYAHLRIDHSKNDPYNLSNNPTRRWPLQWEALSVLHQLKFLDIHRLSNHETAELIVVMPRLVKLHSLILACEPKEHHSRDGGCPLESFFDQIFRAPTDVESSSFPGLSNPWPPNLISLSLIDTRTLNRSLQPQRTRSLVINEGLTHLNIDLLNVGWIPVIVNCLSESTLQDLAITGCSLDRKFLAPTDGAHLDHAHLDHAVIKHKKSLHKIRLLRAWNTDRRWIEEVNENWQGIFSIQELVLGTRNPGWYCGFLSEWHEQVPEPTLLTYLCGFEWENQPCSSRWGSELRRVRIDDLDIDDLDASVLSEPSYSHLKILMLRPGSSTSHNCVREVADENDCTELAKHILIHATLSLRVIVIDIHWYWINRDIPGNDIVLWNWRDARDDAAQNQLIDSTLDKSDFDFIKLLTGTSMV